MADSLPKGSEGPQPLTIAAEERTHRNVSLIVDCPSNHHGDHVSVLLSGLEKSCSIGYLLVEAARKSERQIRIRCSNDFDLPDSIPVNEKRGVIDEDSLEKFCIGRTNEQVLRELGASDGTGADHVLKFPYSLTDNELNLICCTDSRDIAAVADSLVFRSSPLIVMVAHELIHFLHSSHGSNTAWDEFGSVANFEERDYLKALWENREEQITIGSPVRSASGGDCHDPYALTENMLRFQLKFPQRLAVHPFSSPRIPTRFKPREFVEFYRGFDMSWPAKV